MCVWGVLVCEVCGWGLVGQRKRAVLAQSLVLREVLKGCNLYGFMYMCIHLCAHMDVYVNMCVVIMAVCMCV